MRKAFLLLTFLVLLTTGISLVLPAKTEDVFVYYLNTDRQVQESSPPPAPSSVFCLEDGRRLSLEYIAKHKNYVIHSPLATTKNHTRISLLLEQLDQSTVNAPASITASIVDDLGQRYQQLHIEGMESVGCHIWRYTLVFPPLNPQTRNVAIYVEIDGTLFELNGASIP